MGAVETGPGQRGITGYARLRSPLMPERFGAFFGLGAYTLLLQVVLVRACFGLFSGNELSVALQLGLWLLFTAAGGAFGAAVPGRWVRALGWLMPLLGVWAVVAVRLLPAYMAAGVGRETPLLWAIGSLAAAQAPVNVVAGMLFPLLWRTRPRKGTNRTIGHFYAAEAFGGFSAGLLFTFLFVGWVHGITLITAASLVATALYAARGRSVAALGAAAVLGVFLGLGPARLVDAVWWQATHPGAEHVMTLQSPYQRIDVGLRDGQHTVYCNGLPAFALDDQHEASTGYRMADVYMALHHEPRRVLVIGEGEPGMPERLTEYEPGVLEYVLLDPAMLDVLAALETTPWFEREGADVHATDGRRFLDQTGKTFDVILLDLPAPVSAAGNRYFTVEAFADAARHLANGGVLALALPSSTHYLGGEHEQFLASVYAALRTVFPSVEVLTGEVMVFVAGQAPHGLELGLLAERFADASPPMRLPGGRLVSEPDMKRAAFEALHTPLFDPFRKEAQLAALEQTGAPVNSDRAPVAYYLNLRRWVRESGLSPARARALFGPLESMAGHLAGRGWLLAAAGAMAAALMVLGWRALSPAAARRGVLACGVCVTGWSGMLGELALIFVYQNHFGQAYQAMGLLFATFMLGLLLGSVSALRLGADRPGRAAAVLSARAAMLAGCGGTALMLPLMSSAFWGQGLLAGLLFAYAFTCGLEYPVANRIYAVDAGGRHTAGVLHAMDHAGAGVATFLGGVVLLPLMGPGATLGVVAGLHLVMAAALLVVFVRPFPRSDMESRALV